MVDVITDAYAAMILERDEFRCTVCGSLIEGERGQDWLLHSRLPSSGGVADDRVYHSSNLITVCGRGDRGCRGALSRCPRVARRQGFVLWRSQEPWQVPVDVWIGPPPGALSDSAHRVAYRLTNDEKRIPVGPMRPQFISPEGTTP